MARRRPLDALPTQPWHDLPEAEQGGAIERLVRDFRTQQSARRSRYIRNLELYEGRSMSGYSAYSYCSDEPLPYTRERLRLMRSAVASAVANIYAPQKPKPQFQTLGATWAQRRKAFKLDKICEGILNQRQGRWINVWAMMVDAGVEAALQGVAAVMVTANHAMKQIEHDLVPLPDLFTDPAEGRNPGTLFCRRPIAEDVALEQYAGRSDALSRAIKGAKPYEWYEGRDRISRPRAVRVVEIDYAWHMPTSRNKDGELTGGHWAAQIGGVVVDSGEWTAPAPPFVFLLWEPWRDGFWGSGLGDEAGQMSQEIDNLDLRLYIREQIASGNKIFYPEGTVKPDDLAPNDPVTMVAYEGGIPPTLAQMVPFSPMELEYLQWRVQTFWDGIGLSQVSAAARREPGVTSGVAIQTLNDTKSGRQLVKGQRFEQAFVDLAHQYIWRIREMAEQAKAEGGKPFAVNWRGKSLMRSIPWEEAEVPDDEFSTTVAPASAFPHDPAGRLDYVQSMYKAGLISQETAKQLMQWPDLESELSMENAETEYIDMLIERYLDAEQKTWDPSQYQPPEAFIRNKVGAMGRFASAWFRARIDQAQLPPDEHPPAEFSIQILSRYMQELDKLMMPLAPPPGAAGPTPLPPGAMPPNGAPMPGMLPPPPPAPMPQPGV